MIKTTMKLTRIVYYCVHTDGRAALDQHHGPFTTLQEARKAASSLVASEFHGVIEKHYESKQDDKDPVEPLDEYFYPSPRSIH